MIDQLEEELKGPSSKYALLLETTEKYQNFFSKRYDKNSSDYRIAIVHTIEGGHALGGSLERNNFV